MEGGSKAKQERKPKVKDEPDVKPSNKGEPSRKVKVERRVEKVVHTKSEPGLSVKAEVTVARTKTTVEKRERKVYNLPGQKHDPPEERDGLRVFYESLYNQRPDSEMAQIWMMEYGMLERKEAEAVLDWVRKKKSGLVNYNSPAKGSTGGTAGRGGSASASNGAKKGPPPKARETKPEKPSSNGKAAPKAKRKPSYDDEDDDESDREVIPKKRVRGSY